MTNDITPPMPGDPTPPRKRHRVRTVLLVLVGALAVIIVASVIASAAGGPHVTKASPPSSPAPAATRSPAGLATDPNGFACVPPLDAAGYCPGDDPSSTPASTPDNLTGPLGTGYAVTTTDDSGNTVTYTVTADKVLDPAQGADEFSTPDAGKRFVGVRFTITGTGGYASDDANNDAVIMGSDGQTYTPDFSTLAAGTNFNDGDFGVTDGHTVTGWVTFQVPEGVAVASVQWQADSGLGGSQRGHLDSGIMTTLATLEYRDADSDGEWTRKDPADRAEWQWHDSPDWLASEALWLMGEGCEVRLVSTGIDTAEHPNLRAEMFGDYTPQDGGSGCLSLNPPGDDPPVPADAYLYGKPDEHAGRRVPRPS